MAVSWSNFARYVLIAVASLAIGIVVNMAMGHGLGRQNFFDPSFFLLLVPYCTFHAVALPAAAMLSAVFSIPVRCIIYLSLSVVGFLASIYLLSPSKFHGIHLFVICWGSLVLIALDYIWNWRHHQNESSA
jgi:hypothetical protein